MSFFYSRTPAVCSGSTRAVRAGICLSTACACARKWVACGLTGRYILRTFYSSKKVKRCPTTMMNCTLGGKGDAYVESSLPAPYTERSRRCTPDRYARGDVPGIGVNRAQGNRPAQWQATCATTGMGNQHAGGLRNARYLHPGNPRAAQSPQLGISVGSPSGRRSLHVLGPPCGGAGAGQAYSSGP